MTNSNRQLIISITARTCSLFRAVVVLLALSITAQALAAVLPEDRADLLYHAYDGGGATIDGPAMLVRKGFSDKFSLSGRYYVDSVSSASVDVVTTASAYSEQRNETGIGATYLYDSTLFNFSYTQSDENDFEAQSYFFNVSQEMFGALTTVTLGYGLGDDTVKRNGDLLFEEQVDRQHYQLGLTQVITKNWIMGLSYEAITDEGFLNNPYRSVRYADSSNPAGYSYEAELYPNTRTSNSVALKSRYYLKHGAAVKAGYRYFSDTWNIEAHTADIGYVHKFGDKWKFEIGYRFHSQTAADFYSDLFSRSQEQNFIARDKELSTFSDHMLRLGGSWEFNTQSIGFVERGTLNFYINHIRFKYDNFRNLTVVAPSGIAGEEPLYEFNANVIQLFVSVWY